MKIPVGCSKIGFNNGILLMLTYRYGLATLGSLLHFLPLFLNCKLNICCPSPLETKEIQMLNMKHSTNTMQNCAKRTELTLTSKLCRNQMYSTSNHNYHYCLQFITSWKTIHYSRCYDASTYHMRHSFLTEHMHKSLPNWIVKVSHEPARIQQNVEVVISQVHQGLSLYIYLLSILFQNQKDLYLVCCVWIPNNKFSILRCTY